MFGLLVLTLWWSAGFGEQVKVEVYALSSWRLEVKWNVSGPNQTYEVQVARTSLYGVVHQSNVSAGVPVSSWNWTSSLPLECADHSVRVRHVLNRTLVSTWSQWATHYGQQNISSDRARLFPMEKVLQEGSSAHFCCIPPTGAQVTEILFRNTPYPLIPIGPLVRAITVHTLNSTHFGVNLICRDSTGTEKAVLNYVTFPPERPQNLSCWTVDLQNIVCSWTTVRRPNLNDHHRRKYTLHIQGSGKAEVQCEVDSCVFPVLPDRDFYSITVVVRNSLGEEKQSYSFNITHRVFPVLDLVSVSPGVTDANGSWVLKGNFTGLLFTCQFILEPSGKTTELQLVVSDADQRLSVCERSLKPSSQYSTRGRCAVQGSSWGPWSSSSTFHTEPLISLDLWMKITHTAGDRSLSIMWKPLISSSQCVLEMLEVCVRCVSSTQRRWVGKTKLQVEFRLDYSACNVSVQAITHTGSSVTSHINVPAFHKEPILKEKRIVGNPEGFLLSWSALSSASCGYTVEWCMMGSEAPCDLRWRKVSANQTTLFLSAEGFSKGRRYTFNIYSCQEEVHRVQEKLLGYLEEQKPLNAPRLYPRVSWSSVTVQWSFNEDDASHPGFITAYLLTVQSSDTHSFLNISVESPHNKSAVLRGLQEGRPYTLRLSACTRAGCGPESVRTITTLQNHYLMLVKVVTPLLVLLVCSCCLWPCRKTLKSIAVDIFSFPSDHSMKLLELDDRLYEVSEMLRVLQVEDCKCCKVETVDVKSSTEEKSRLIFTEHRQTQTDPAEWEEPMREEPSRERVMSVTNLTYLSSLTYTSESNQNHDNQDSGPISSDYVMSITMVTV